MYKSFVGEKVTVVVSSRGDNLLEYVGTLSNENEDAIELTNVDISYLMLSIQREVFGGLANNMRKYQENLERVIINKRYIIYCDK